MKTETIPETSSYDQQINQRADNVLHITCSNCQPRKGKLSLMFCGIWDILLPGYYQPGKEIYCPICEDLAIEHIKC